MTMNSKDGRVADGEQALVNHAPADHGPSGFDPSRMPWWFTNDEEHLWGARSTRDEAIDAGIHEYDGKPFLICQGGHFRNKTDIFEIEWISDRFDDANDEYAGEENASESWTDGQCRELEQELNAVMQAWCVRHGHDKAYGIDAGPYERIEASAIEARRAATLGAVHESAVPTADAQSSGSEPL